MRWIHQYKLSLGTGSLSMAAARRRETATDGKSLMPREHHQGCDSVYSLLAHTKQPRAQLDMAVLMENDPGCFEISCEPVERQSIGLSCGSIFDLGQG